MCTYIVEQTVVAGSAKGPKGWLAIDRANVMFDHPANAPFEHALLLDFVASTGGVSDRVAVELSEQSARALVDAILAALARGDEAHATSS